MTKKICLFTIPLLAALGIGCSTTNTPEAANANANTATTNPAQAQATTAPGPDNSEIATTVDKEGTRTETRTFHNNPRISKVIVTTRNGQRTVKVTSASGVEKVVNTTEDVLQATGDKVADAAGFVAEKGKAGANEVADKAEDVKDKTVSATKKGANEVGDKAEDAKDKTVSTTKKAAKKVGSAVKKVVP